MTPVKQKILIVDGSAKTAAWIEQEFNSKWFAWVHVKSDQEAFRELKSNSYDIMICNRQIHQFDCLEFVEKVGTEYPGIKLVLLTEDPDTTKIYNTLKYHVDYLFSPPFADSEGFKLKLHLLLGNGCLDPGSQQLTS